MAFTRFHDDPCRIMKRLQESTDAALYAYNVPGPGNELPFVEDPHVRLQYWGANRAADAVRLESALRGLGKPLSRASAPSTLVPPSRSFPSLRTEITETPRAVAPAWQLRDVPVPWVEVLPPPAQLVDPIPRETRIAARAAWS